MTIRYFSHVGIYVSDFERVPACYRGLPGPTHISLAVADLEGAIGAFERAARVDNPELGAHAIFVTERDGTRIEPVQARAASLA